MNYIYQINAFWEKFTETEGARGYHGIVYLSLLQLNNECSWKRVFDVTIGQALNQAKVDKDTYYKALDFLNNNGFFDYYQKGKNQFSKAIFSLKVLYDISDSITDSGQNADENAIPNIGQQTRQQTGSKPDSKQNNHKHINIETNKQETINNIGDSDFFENEILEDTKVILLATEEKKKEKNSAQKRKSFDDVIWPFDSTGFMQAWDLWIEYRKEKRFTAFKPIGLQGALNDLANMSNGDEQMAIELIHNAIAKGWQGIHVPKDFTNNKYQSNGRNNTSQSSTGITLQGAKSALDHVFGSAANA